MNVNGNINLIDEKGKRTFKVTNVKIIRLLLLGNVKK